MQTMTLRTYTEQRRMQFVELIDSAYICPACGTVQSARDFIKAGAGKNYSDVEMYAGFMCIGNYDHEKGCKYQLGGLFKRHKLEVVHVGERFPFFELATREEAQAHAKGFSYEQ